MVSCSLTLSTASTVAKVDGLFKPFTVKTELQADGQRDNYKMLLLTVVSQEQKLQHYTSLAST